MKVKAVGILHGMRPVSNRGGRRYSKGANGILEE